MRIDGIRLCNIGSYLGEHEIPLCCDDERNIVLIGGKNGAGKTTLFDAVRLCLYGCAAWGYEQMTAAYKNRIVRMISDGAKRGGAASARIELDIGLEDGQDIGRYTLARSWEWSEDALAERFAVSKDGEAAQGSLLTGYRRELSADETEDFNAYLFSVIPPALLSLCFFDGEQMAERFIGGDGDALKAAFLTLCGLDSLYMMRQNFARHIGQKKETSAAGAYLEAKRKAVESQARLDGARARLDACCEAVHDAEERLKKLERDYAKTGGVTEAEWRAKFDGLKAEEKKREELNAETKRLFAEELPFLILRGRIKELDCLMARELPLPLDKKECADFRVRLLVSVCASLGVDSPSEEAVRLAEAIEKNFFKDSESSLLRLSARERDRLKAQIWRSRYVSKEKLAQARSALAESLEKTKGLRREIESCTIERVREYNAAREALQRDIVAKQAELEDAQNSLANKTSEKADADAAFEKANARLDEELRNNSIIDLSERGALFADELLETLTADKRRQVEEAFLEELNRLNQKDSLVSRIEVDGGFNIRVYAKGADGEEAETNAARFSKGEKQIFIMALYWALMKAARVKAPFVIDTPFARIDATHRERIAARFFGELSGQVIIFSTDEELVGRPLELIADKIGSTLLLENSDNKKTIIKKGEYFREGEIK